jgi:hypothetical protein
VLRDDARCGTANCAKADDTDAYCSHILKRPVQNSANQALRLGLHHSTSTHGD